MVDVIRCDTFDHMTTATGGPKVATSFGLTPDAKKRLDALASQERRTRAELIRMAIDEYLDRHESPKRGRA